MFLRGHGVLPVAMTGLEILICLTVLEIDSAGDVHMPACLQEPDMITMCKYGDVDLDEDPVVVLPCGHLLTMQSMDGHMELAKAYTLTESGETMARCQLLGAVIILKVIDLNMHVGICPTLQRHARYGIWASPALGSMPSQELLLALADHRYAQVKSEAASGAADKFRCCIG